MPVSLDDLNAFALILLVTDPGETIVISIESPISVLNASKNPGK
jgi:hypothetical protein